MLFYGLLVLCLSVFIECQSPPIFPSEYEIEYTRNVKCRFPHIPLTEDISEFYDYENQKQRFDINTIIQQLPNITIIVLQRWDLQTQYTFSPDQGYCYKKSLAGWQMQSPNYLANYTYNGQQSIDKVLCNQWDDNDGCAMFTRVDNSNPKRMITAEGYVLDFGPMNAGPLNPTVFNIPQICNFPIKNQNDTVFFADKSSLITHDNC